MHPCVIIANRGAGSFRQPELDRVCSRLEAAGRPVERLFCDDFSAMTETAATISSSPNAPLIIAAGGDGTINAVFNGLAGNGATCAILPLGTANVLAIELGQRDPETALQKIIRGESRPFTAGVISNGSKQSRFFLMAGVGFDGSVVRGVTPQMKRRFGKGAYLLSTLGRLTAWERGELRITTEAHQFTCHSLIACNAAHYGGAFRLAPAASIFTPTLELLVIRNNSRYDLVSLATDTILHRQNSFPTERLEITGSKPVQVDGDDWGDVPVKIYAESNFAKIIV